jgi:hypothetical protein
MAKFLPVFIVACGFQMTAIAQENSPYSRYGLGDLAPNHNIFSRGMGGIAAGTLDYQSINFVNPASLASISNTIFDIGAEIDVRTLKSANPVKKYSAANSIFSYLQLAFPVASEKMRKKNIGWGMSFGLKPVTKINYKIETASRLSNIDSIHTLYEGTGGVNQAYFGTALKIKGFSFGVNAGYMFGNKNYSTKVIFVNDTVPYYKSNSANQTNFGGFFINGGIQYEIWLNKDKKSEPVKMLRFGAYGNLQQKLKASRDDIRETFSYDANNSSYRVDSVYDQKNVSGTIEYPSTYGAGFSYTGEHWMYGADYEAAQWAKYTYYGQADASVQNNFTVRVGAQYYPAKLNTPVRKYFNFVKYRAGFYYGPDYIRTGNNRPDYSFTLGAGMPLTSLQRLSYSGEYVVLNTALEVGGRGDKNSNLRENMVRFSIGVAMNARWFRKIKYD